MSCLSLLPFTSALHWQPPLGSGPVSKERSARLMLRMLMGARGTVHHTQYASSCVSVPCLKLSTIYISLQILHVRTCGPHHFVIFELPGLRQVPRFFFSSTHKKRTLTYGEEIFGRFLQKMCRFKIAYCPFNSQHLFC